MPLGEILGLIGGAFTTGSFIPQVIRIYRIKSAGDISLPFTIAMLMGSILWLSYGIVSGLVPVVLWNTLAIVLVLALLIGKIKYGKR